MERYGKRFILIEETTATLPEDARKKISEALKNPRFRDMYRPKYPNKADLHPDSKLSIGLNQYIDECIQDAKNVIDLKKDEYKELEMSCSSFAYRDDVDQTLWRRSKEHDRPEDGIPNYDRSRGNSNKRPIRVVIPASLAARNMFCSNMMSVFGQFPIHRYNGIGTKKAIRGAAKMERAIQRQNQHPIGDEISALNTLFSDGATYGRGLMLLQWKRHKVFHRATAEVTDLLEDLLRGNSLIPKGIRTGDLIRYLDEVVSFEGCHNEPLDPWRTYVDPDVSCDTIQQAQYMCWQYVQNSMNMITEESDDDDLFNAHYTRVFASEGNGESPFWSDDESYRQARYEYSGQTPQPNVRDRAVITEGFIRLIPNERGIGDNTVQDDYPQIWEFKRSADKVFNKLKPLERDHGFYPVTCCAPTGGRDVLPTSYLAQTLGQQRYVDFMFNTDMQNVAKCLNDMWIINQRYVNKKSFEEGGPGKLITLTQSGQLYDKPFDHMLKQLDVKDITAGNIGRIKEAMAIIDHVLGQQNPMHGDMSGMPDKMGSQGANLAFNRASGILQWLIQIVGNKTMTPLALMEASDTAQFMEEDVILRIEGRYDQQLREELMERAQRGEDVDPNGGVISASKFDFDPNYEVELRNASMNNPNPQALSEFAKTLISQEGVLAEIMKGQGGIPWAKMMLAESLRSWGITQAADMLMANQVDVQVVPDQQAMDMQQSGQTMPINDVSQMEAAS